MLQCAQETPLIETDDIDGWLGGTEGVSAGIQQSCDVGKSVP